MCDAGRLRAYLSPVIQDPTVSLPSQALRPAERAEVELCREWYEAHGEVVYGYFRFHVPSPDVAEDLTADTFLKVVRAADRYDAARASARTWILSVARNVLVDHLRRARLRQYVPLGTMRDLVHDAPSPEERLLREEEVGRLLDALAGLPPGDREIISLRYGSALDGEEIAGVLGISAANVRTRVWRALKRLRQAMAE